MQLDSIRPMGRIFNTYLVIWFYSFLFICLLILLEIKVRFHWISTELECKPKPLVHTGEAVPQKHWINFWRAIGTPCFLRTNQIQLFRVDTTTISDLLLFLKHVMEVQLILDYKFKISTHLHCTSKLFTWGQPSLY